MINNLLLTLLVAAEPPSTMTCEDGYKLQGKNCVRKVREPAKFTCGMGVLFKDQCTFKSEPVTKCPAGTAMREGVCAGINPVAKIKRDAPLGFFDDGIMYVKEVPAELKTICPFGEYDLESQHCIVEKNMPPRVKTFCPPGSNEDGKGCAMNIPLETMPVCDQGVLTDGSCIFTNQDAPADIGEFCPADAVPNGDHCVRQMPGHIIEQCPEGGEPEFGMCEIVLTKKMMPKPICQDGYERAGKRCRMKRAGYMITACPIGSTTVGDECLVYSTAPMVKSAPVCPAGYQPSDGKDGCYRVEIYDCTPPAASKSGVRGTTTATVAQTCEKKEYVDVIIEESCPEGFNLSEGACMKARPVEKQELCNLNSKPKDQCFDYVYKSPLMRTECDAPFVMKDGVCGKVMQVPSKKICMENGSPDVENCFATQAVSKLREVGCPIGFDLIEGVCYQEIKAQPRMVCEDQTKELENCSIIHRVEPVVRPVCPEGTVQDPVSPVICIEKTVFQPVNICENGSSVEDCVDKIELPYMYQCPFGSVEAKNGCQKITAYPSLEFCEDGSILVNGSCIRSVPAISNCPVGTQAITGYCVGTVVEEPTITFTQTCIGKGCESSMGGGY